MSTTILVGVIHNGRVEVTEPITLPEGTEVVISTREVNPPTKDLQAADEPAMTSSSSIGSSPLNLRPRKIKTTTLLPSNNESRWAPGHTYEGIRHRLVKLMCWPYEKPAAYEYARLFAELRRIGGPMRQIDVQLAAVAFTLGDCTVISYDTDLVAIPGLTVENWAVNP